MLKLCTYSAVLCENILYINKRQKHTDWTQTFDPHCKCRPAKPYCGFRSAKPCRLTLKILSHFCLGHTFHIRTFKDGVLSCFDHYQCDYAACQNTLCKCQIHQFELATTISNTKNLIDCSCVLLAVLFAIDCCSY